LFFLASLADLAFGVGSDLADLSDLAFLNDLADFAANKQAKKATPPKLAEAAKEEKKATKKCAKKGAVSAGPKGTDERPNERTYERTNVRISSFPSPDLRKSASCQNTEKGPERPRQRNPSNSVTDLFFSRFECFSRNGS